MWQPVCQLFSSGEGAQSWLEQMRVNEGLQELELPVAMAPADTNTIPPREGIGSRRQPTEVGPHRRPDTSRALTLLLIPASEDWSDSLRSLGGAIMKSPTAPWYREEMPQIFQVPRTGGNRMMAGWQ